MSERILIFQTAFLGDCVLSLPLVNTLYDSFNLPIDVVCKKGTEDIFKSCPSVDKTIVFDKKGSQKGIKGVLNLAGKLKKRNYRRVFLLQRSFRSGLITYLARIRERTGFSRGGAKFFLTQKIPFDWKKHDLERQLDLARLAGCEKIVKEFRLQADKKLKKKWQDKLKGPGHLVGIAPQSSWGTKKWPAERFTESAAELANKNTLVILGSEKEKWPENKNIIDLTGQTDLKDLIAVSSLLDVLLSNDCGVMHVAAAMGVRVAVIYGATVPALGFSPYGEGHEIIESDLECRPCSLHGPRKCPENHFRCMLSIEPERVMDSVRKIIGENGG